MERLARVGDPAAQAAAETIAAKSPTAVTVTLAALRRARGLAIAGGGAEPGIPGVRCGPCAGRTLPRASGRSWWTRTGTRAWPPAALAEVSQELVAGAFAGLGERELGLAAPTTDFRS